MKTQPKKTERIHAMDSLRAIMMLFGILFHAAITYVDVETSAAWTVRDLESSSVFLTFLVSYIHIFRMPVFMVVAGFFAALLFYERSPRKMIINRVKRILNPFVVAILILWPICNLAFIYSISIFSGAKNIEAEESINFLDFLLNTFLNLDTFIPKNTLHLWFLYYLMMFCVVSFMFGLLFKRFPFFTSKISLVFNKIIKKPILKIIVFSVLTYVLLQFIENETVVSFVPHVNTFGYYFYFYMFGWVLFKSKSLLSTFKNHDWFLIISGTLLYIGSLICINFNVIDIHPQIEIFINSTSVWLFVFGVTGLFMRYASNHSLRMRYISDASYWVYLVHLPFTVFIPALISELQVPGIVKYFIVVLVTTFFCFITYHYFVRGTFIGKFLNGRKYSKRLSDIKNETSVGNLKPVLDK